MPFTQKGTKIMKSMVSQYGPKKGKKVFYTSKNKGVIKGVDRTFKHGSGKLMGEACLRKVGAV